MRNWIRLPIETKMNISKYFNIHIRKRNQRDPHIKSRKEIFQKPNGTKVSFFIFDINGTLDRYFFSNDFRVRVDHSNFDELYDFCVLNPFFKNHLLFLRPGISIPSISIVDSTIALITLSTSSSVRVFKSD